MTAPSLLDEIEGIVRLAEKATPGPFVVDGYGDVTANGEDVARIASDGYSAYHDAHLFADAANFIRAHHAEIADMAKRLEAAERDARVTKRSAETLCRIYFEIAAEAVGEDKVRAERDRRIHATQECEE